MRTGQDIHTVEIWEALVGLTLDQAAKLIPTALILGLLRSRPSATADGSAKLSKSSESVARKFEGWRRDSGEGSARYS